MLCTTTNVTACCATIWFLLRPPGWGSFYDDAGVLSAEGGLESTELYALIDRRQTTFNDTIPEYHDAQLEWAAGKPEIARLEPGGVVLAALYSK